MAELYKDVDTVERTEITREGKVMKVYRTSAVTVSGAHFTQAKVNELLTKQAKVIEDIKAL